jgi:4-aminobutyrate aminotransferase
VIQGEGGINVASRSFVRALRKYSNEFGVPLILDEVQSGMGRTGKWWAFEHYGVKPDIITVAKALQVGATLYDRKLDPAEPGVLSSTWGAGNRIDMAIGKKIIDIIIRDRLLANAITMGDILKKGLLERVGRRGIIDVRGIGLMLGIEFDTAVTRSKKIVKLFRNGILVLPAGRKSMRIMPPLIITKEEILEGLSIIDTVLAKSS